MKMFDTDYPPDVVGIQQALTGRRIVQVTVPDDLDSRQWKHLVLELDNGAVVDISGQGYETHCVTVRIDDAA